LVINQQTVGSSTCYLSSEYLSVQPRWSNH